jgi:hypothetical protein
MFLDMETIFRTKACLAQSDGCELQIQITLTVDVKGL